MGCASTHDPEREHNRVRCKDHVHVCVELHAIVADIPLLPPDQRLQPSMVLVDTTHQLGL